MVFILPLNFKSLYKNTYNNLLTRIFCQFFLPTWRIFLDVGALVVSTPQNQEDAYVYQKKVVSILKAEFDTTLFGVVRLVDRTAYYTYRAIS